MREGNDPIFVLDSGLGGLTVVRALLERLPDQHIVYFGDTARLPYGSKTKQTITHYVRQIIDWGTQFKPRHVVIACNTASALALSTMRQTFAPLTISGVIEPGARAAAAGAGSKEHVVIGVIATEATVRSEAYQQAIRKRRSKARVLLSPTPLLVPMIEEGRSPDDPLVDLALKQYLKPMVDRDIDALVLGCTHYPLLKGAIQRVVGDRIPVIDSAERCAEDVALKLAAGPKPVAMGIDNRSRVSVFVTDDPDRFERLAPRFLGFAIDRPTLVSPETLYQPMPAELPAVRASA